jgi:hypothetical protein
VQGTALGLRLEQETWFDISPRFYLSADASYGTAFQEYCALTRVGFRARPRFALGLEGGAIGNEEYDAGRAGGFLRMNFRDTEFTLSGASPATISKTTRAVMSRSASIDHFELCEISLCQIALPAPLRQCLASTSACVTQTGPARHGKHRPLWSCILCRGMSTGLPEGLSPEISMT